MKSKSILFASMLTAGVVSMNAQAQTAAAPAEEKTVTVYGNVQNNIWYNTRQNTDLRDGIFNLYPADAKNLNRNANVVAGQGVQTSNADTQAIGNVGFSAIFSRLGVKFAGGTAFGGKLSGLIEADFFGVNGAYGGGTETLLRLRHAAVDLAWEKTTLKVGQYWNPNFIPECFPTTPNFALSINPFGFIPQVRVTHKITKDVSVMGMMHLADLQGFSAAATGNTSNQSFGTSTLNNGVAMAQLSQMPSFAAQVKYDNGMIWATVGGEVNFLRPNTTDNQVVASGLYTTTEANGGTIVTKNITTNLMTYNLLASAKLTLKDLVTVKLRADYGQNYTQYVGIGAAVQYRDITDNALKYRAANMLNAWAEVIVTKHPMFQPALFVGYVQNMGINALTSGTDYTAGSWASVYNRGVLNTTTGRTFSNFIRVAPRLDIRSGKFLLALEYELSQMTYGDMDATTLKIADATATTNPRKFTATNNRVTASVVYSF